MEFRIENIPIDELIPHPDNLRIYGENHNVGDLVTSITEHGLLRPLIIDQDKRIIDGVRRWTASKILKKKTIPCETRELVEEDSAISSILTYNRYRQKTPKQIFNESRELKKLETEKAKKRMKKEKDVPISAQGHAKVRDIVSRYFDMGHTKFGELESVFEAEDVYPEIAEKVTDGTWSVHKGYMKIKDTIQKQKDMVDMKAKISEALSHVKRESLREKLEEKYLSDESDLSKTSIKYVKKEIDHELGLPVFPNDEEQWKEIKEKLIKILNQNPEISSSREWIIEDRRFLQTLTWMDVGQNIPNLNRREHPKERFSSYEEADAYAELFGGYCDGLHKLGKKTVWILLVRK